jgi:hypothetical protein
VNEDAQTLYEAETEKLSRYLTGQCRVEPDESSQFLVRLRALSPEGLEALLRALAAETEN